MKKVFRLLACIVLCGLCACFKPGAHQSLPIKKIINNNVSIRKLWSQSFRLTKPYGHEYKFVASDNHNHILVVNKNKIICLNANQQKLWEQRFNSLIGSKPGLSAEHVAFGLVDGNIVLLDISTGQQLWQENHKMELVAPPLISQSKLYLHTLNGQLKALDKVTGRLLWVHDEENPALVLKQGSASKLHNGILYTGLANGKILLSNANTGSTLSSITIARPKGHTDISRLVDIAANLIIEQNNLYAVAYYGPVAAFNMPSKLLSPIWQKEFGSSQDLAVDQSNLYLLNNESRIIAIDKANGKIKWQQESIKPIKWTVILAHGEYLIVGDRQGYINILERQTGMLLHRHHFGSGRITQLISHNKQQILAFTKFAKLGLLQIDG